MRGRSPIRRPSSAVTGRSPGPRWTRPPPAWRTGFVDQGLKPGDRVAVCSPNSIELVQVYLGLFKAGLIVVPINTRLKPEEVHYILGHAGTRMAFCEPCFTAAARTGRRGIPCLQRAARDAGRDRRPARCRPRQPGHDHLHLRHDGPAQGRRPHPRLSFRDGIERLPACPGHVRPCSAPLPAADAYFGRLVGLGRPARRNAHDPAAEIRARRRARCDRKVRLHHRRRPADHAADDGGGTGCAPPRRFQPSAR